MNRIRCNKVDYRQGFIEVQSGIHDDCINLETWQIDPGINIGNLDLSDGGITDDDVTGNTEIELSLKNAEHLITLLQNAINSIKSGSSS